MKIFPCDTQVVHLPGYQFTHSPNSATKMVQIQLSTFPQRAIFYNFQNYRLEWQPQSRSAKAEPFFGGICCILHEMIFAHSI